jgi:hypothetical protein
MDMQAIKDEVMLKLTGDVLDNELSDSTQTKIINSCLREIQRYIDTFSIITVPFSKCIDLSQYKISSVVGVRRTEAYVGDNDTSGTGMVDPLYASQWQLLSGVGGLAGLNDYTYNLSAWNTVLQIQNTISTDLAHYYDKSANKLYINVATNIPQNITIIYIPRFDDVSQITSDYWIDILVRLAVAQSKIIVGRVRSKFKQTNALWTLDGDTLLQEGTTELEAIRSHLVSNTQLVFGID